jgi:hypothetical protein
MRDLKAELDLLQQTTAYKWGEDGALIAEEAIKRAIAAESQNTESYVLLYGAFDKVKDEAEQLKCDNAALREENEQLKIELEWHKHPEKHSGMAAQLVLEAQREANRQAHIREENDLQRASIQQLLAQVVGLRDCLDEATELIADIRDGNYIPDTFTTQPWKKILSSPDPGAEIRERMAKLEAIAEAAQEILAVKADNYSCLKLWSNLSLSLAALGDRP